MLALLTYCLAYVALAQAQVRLAAFETRANLAQLPAACMTRMWLRLVSLLPYERMFVLRGCAMRARGGSSAASWRCPRRCPTYGWKAPPEHNR